MAQSAVTTIELPPPGSLTAAFVEWEKERTYWEEHDAEFRAAYPDQFVAVVAGEVVATGETLTCLQAALEARGLKFGPGTWIELFQTDPPLLIL
jgi:hypothetical protein